jgi:hypothetical protein
MKPGKFSHMPLVIGLVLGMVAVWASATPAVGTAVGTGGGTLWFEDFIDGEYVAASRRNDCGVCAGTFAGSCTDYGMSPTGQYMGCSGGYASVAYCVNPGYPGSATTHANGLSACWSTYNPYCNDLYDADCY